MELIRRLRAWCEQRRVAREMARWQGRVWRTWEHVSWGDNIEWLGVTAGVYRLAGWMKRHPQVGDHLLTRTTGGGTARLVFIEVDSKADPRDMFIARALFIRMEQQA